MKKLSPAMVHLNLALNIYGYVDPMRDCGRHTTTGTICALIDRGILREADRRGRHYPATNRDDVHEEAILMDWLRIRCRPLDVDWLLAEFKGKSIDELEAEYEDLHR